MPLLIILPLLCTSCGTRKAQLSFTAMDTYMTIQAYGKNPEQALSAAKERVLQIEESISTTIPSSDVYKLNHGISTPLSSDTLELLSFSLELADKTNGALNPALYPITSVWGFTTGAYTVPDAEQIAALLPLTDYTKIKLAQNQVELESGMSLDFGATGKGYAGDQIIALLKNRDINCALLDLGGNIQALGTKNDGSLWNIGIKNPWTGSPAAALKIADKAVITSGGYERFFTGDDGRRYIHIFDGTTGRPVENGTASVTIVAASGLYADGLSTALFVMGQEKAAEFWRQHRDFEMIIFTEDKALYYTEGLKDQLTILDDFTSVNMIR